MMITSGSTAIVRAMHRRCCWPPDSPMPGLPRRSLTSSHRPGAAQRLLDALLDVAALAASAAGRRRRCRRSTSWGTGSASGRPCRSRGARTRRRRRRRRRRASSSSTLPSARAPGISSCMRLMQRTTVDLPQPDGPDHRRDLVGARRSASTPLHGMHVAVVGVQLVQLDRARLADDLALAVALGRLLDGRVDVLGTGCSARRPRHAASCGLGAHASRLLRWIARAIRVRIRIIATSVRAAPHARSTMLALRLPHVVEDLDRQRVHLLAEVPARRVDGERGEQQRRRLARAAGDGQHRAGEQARAARSAGRSGTPPSSAARRAPAPPRAASSGTRLQHDLGRARDDRQHQQRQRDRALPAGEVAAEARRAPARCR